MKEPFRHGFTFCLLMCGAGVLAWLANSLSWYLEWFLDIVIVASVVCYGGYVIAQNLRDERERQKRP